MTVVSREPASTTARPHLSVRGLVLPQVSEPARARLALLGVTGLALVLYLWNLTVSGYANTYYSAAALAASKSWSAFFFGSFDPANFITVDKPPLAIMVMGLSVRLFGLSHLSVLLPQAIAGTLTVALLFLVMRRSFGLLAASIAALVMALTPAAVLIFRFNNPDALLTLLLVAGAWALLRALDDGSLRWTALAAAFVGFAFLTKYLQAYLVLPGFALVYGVAADTTLRRRLIGLLVAAGTVLVTSGWWVAIVQLIPAADRPWIGGSTTGSPLDLIVGYDGLGRIFGSSGPGGGGGFGGVAGLFRLFNADFFGEIAWFVPLAAALLVVGIWLRRHEPATNRAFAAYLLWGAWFVTTAAVFSFMSGIIHSYYAVALAPAVAALVGAGVADLWAARRSHAWLAAGALGLAFAGTAWWGWQLLARTPNFVPFLGPLAFGLAVAAAAVLLLAAAPRLRPTVGRLSAGALALGLCATLLAPGAYAVSTIGTAYGGGDPHPGPATAETGFAGAGRPGGLARGAFDDGGFAAGAPPVGLPAPGGNAPAGGGAAPGAFNGPNTGPRGTQADSALVSYLVANRGSATWIVAVNSSQDAGSIELATGLPVMAMGGFNGQDPVPTLAQLQQYIASGELRYVIVGGGGFGGPDGSSVSAERTAWVTSACKAVDYGGSGSSALYDCAGATS